MSQSRTRGSRHFDPYRRPVDLERNRAQASGRRRLGGSRWPSISLVRDGSSCVEAEAMPTYAYRCEQCRETFERIETISEHETAKPQCPKCGSDEVVSVPTPFVAITGKKS
jgi:putative FmdB family regulatory protein